MIKEGVALMVLLIGMNATLLVIDAQMPADEKIFSDTSIFNYLPSQLNDYTTQFDTNATADLGFEGTSSISSPNEVERFAGYIFAIAANAANIIKFGLQILFGYMQILWLIDPTHTWGFVIIAIVGLLQSFFMLYIVLEIGGTLLGARGQS